MIRGLLRPLRVLGSLLRERKKAKRSPQWASVRDRWLKVNVCCAACTGTTRLQVHHVQPFHLDPWLELDPKNLITLCMGKPECHLRIGHGDSWKAYNPQVKSDALKFRMMPARRVEVVEEAKKRRRME